MKGFRTFDSLRLCALVTLASVVSIAGCKSKPAELPPVQNGSTMRFMVQKIMGQSVVDMDVTLRFSSTGDDKWKLDFDTQPPQPAMMLDWWLNPEKKVIEPFGFGRLWIPMNSRKPAAITDCGRTDKQRKFKQWDVWELSGNCGLLQGSWYYEASTGMLVGWQVKAPAGEFSAYLLEAT